MRRSTNSMGNPNLKVKGFDFLIFCKKKLHTIIIIIIILIMYTVATTISTICGNYFTQHIPLHIPRRSLNKPKPIPDYLPD